MISKKLQDALNKQVNAEIYSAYLYLSMSSYFEEIGLSGFSNWMELQAAEEFSHARRIYRYLYERGGKVTFTSIDTPPAKWDSPKHVFEETCAHEAKVTGMINDLVNLAIDEKDHATNNMLQWFVAEQVEEEATAEEILGKLELVGNEGNGLFMIDREMRLRVLNPAIFTGG